MLEGETMSKRCDTCRWWDNEPYLEIRAAPNQEPGLYGDCEAPLPISLNKSRDATTAYEPIQGDTNAEKCHCFEVRSVVKGLLAKCDPCMLPESYKAYKALAQKLANALMVTRDSLASEGFGCDADVVLLEARAAGLEVS
jgi:hypothetical protein